MIREGLETERREMREGYTRGQAEVCSLVMECLSSGQQILAPVLPNNQTNKCKSVTEADAIQQWAAAEG